MSAKARFAKANTKFSERGEYLTPIMREEKTKNEQTGQETTALVYDQPANYTLKIRRCTWKESRKKDNFYIVEAEVVKSSNPRVAVGQVRTWMQAMDNDVGPTAVTDFMFAALGFDRRQSDELAKIKELDASNAIQDMLAETLDDPSDAACKNSLKDHVVECEVKEIITKGEKKKFNLHTFTPDGNAHKKVRSEIFGDAA